MWASYKGREQAVELLLERGADVNACGNFHIPSLLWAAGRGHTNIAIKLLHHGAKVNFGDKVGLAHPSAMTSDSLGKPNLSTILNLTSFIRL